MAALLSPSMSPETLSDKERQEVIANMKAEPYNGPFSIVEVGAWLGCSMEEAQALWDGVEAHGNPLGIIEMAKERGYAPPLEEPQARIVEPGAVHVPLRRNREQPARAGPRIDMQNPPKTTGDAHRGPLQGG